MTTSRLPWLLAALAGGCSSSSAPVAGSPSVDASPMAEGGAAMRDGGDRQAEGGMDATAADGATAVPSDGGPQKIDGDASNPQPCDSICASHSLACDDATTWPEEGEDPSSASWQGGAHEWYLATDGTMAPRTDACSIAPRSMFTEETLRNYALPVAFVAGVAKAGSTGAPPGLG